MAKRFIFGLRGKALEWALVWAVIFPAYTLFGWNNGIAGSLLALPSWNDTFPRINTLTTSGSIEQSNAQIQGTTVALYPLGAFFGSLSCIWIGDPLGRKKVMALGAAVQAVGVLLECSAFSLPQLIVGRLITGLGFGALSATAPNWQSECARAGHRGAVVLLESLFISLGLALQAWVSLGCSFGPPEFAWRFPLAMSIFWALLLLAALPFVPESPRWLVKKGRVEEAREVLAALDDADLYAEEVSETIMHIEATIAVVSEGRFRDVLSNGPLRLLNRTLLACLAGSFQQFCGINAIAFYESTIFEQYLGLTSTKAKILAASGFTWQTLCSPIGVLTVDRLGRRKLMMISATGMGMCMIVIAGTTAQVGNTAALATAIAFIYLFSLFFPTGFLGLAFLYASEISPLHVRTYVTSLSTATVWMSNFVVAEVTPTALSHISWKYYIVFAAFNLGFIVPVVYFFFPETTNRELEELDTIFRNSSSIFDPVRMSKTLPREAFDQETNREVEEYKAHAVMKENVK